MLVWLGLLLLVIARADEYSGFTHVSVESLHLDLAVCHAMEVVDVIADYYGWIDDADVLAGVKMIAAEVCEHYPHLHCTRADPSPVRDLGQPYHLVNSQPIMIRRSYSPLMIADCISAGRGYSFSDFVKLQKSFTAVFDAQSVYLNNMQLCGFKPSVIMDCGAHVGAWTEKVKQHRFPDASIFMVEANEDHREILAQLNVPFEIALLADEDGVDTVYFKNNDTSISSGNSVYKENNPNNEVWSGFQPVNLQTRTIDSLVQKHGLGKVDFLKLDLQGSELRALKGAQRTLADVEVVQTEFHMVNYNEGAPKMLELYSLLDSMGFALYDMGEVQEFQVTAGVSVNGGEGRKTLIKKLGVDIVFVRKTSHLWEKECTLFPKPLHLSDDSR